MDRNIKATYDKWNDAWYGALRIWSGYVKLRRPLWCMNKEDSIAAGISSSFAMIRLNNHRIVIDLTKVNELKLEVYALKILAHEIVHNL